ncbi:MAG: DNA polymerase III subunit epsilon [Alphaproteobacteria bacterium]|nr:DNA polymerase III subunit epsilon [Alphaproteobacteria bacterium]NCQ88453.1 DNA polymerase III subunit epsilon [Alphaproteobacteria bacterium]NCT05996.1 DNA polymerase III subunit epsilon [Alphaproteobacteria bacterium]
MREIVLDTETTGMDPEKGDKMVEIGCVELINHIPTGRTYHQYLNPERDVPAEVVAVHGLTYERLKKEPTFGEVVSDFLDFIGNDSKLVIHNAAFDMKFINAEIKTYGFASIDPKRIIDTLDIARRKFPGSPANLDALCRRFGINNDNRTLHGALLDSELLAEVYLELLGGRQRGLMIDEVPNTQVQEDSFKPKERVFREPRVFDVSDEEISAHEEMLSNLKDPIWKKLA